MNGLYSIPLGVPFIPALVEKLMDETSSDPLSLARYIIILPSQRGCLALEKAFGDAAPSGCCVLPKILALGDIEEGANLPGYVPDAVPPAMPLWYRLGVLSQLVLAFEKNREGGSQNPARAVRLAQELMRFVDEVETAGLDLRNLNDLVGTDYAAHWELTLNFLKILTDHWPPIFLQAGYSEPAARKRQILENVARNWVSQDPVILAGPTGTSPAAIAFANAILQMPKGRVVLAGLDANTAGKANLPPTHPQHVLSQLLQKLEAPDVKRWVQEDTSVRSRFLSQLMTPIIEDDWHMMPDKSAEVLPHLEAIEAPSILEEARQIALIMRYELETPGTTIALVTPDGELARRVRAALGRWGLYANMSNGIPLTQSYGGRFLLLSSLLTKNMTAADLLSLLKHPLTGKGKDRGEHLFQTRQFEKDVLRGLSLANVQNLPFPGYELCAPLISLSDGELHPLAEFLEAHRTVAESLVGGESPLLWEGEDGKVALELWQNLQDHAHHFPPLRAADYPAFLRNLMSQEIVRDVEGIGSRLAIIGTLEARFFPADVMILGSLNEGTWPHSAQDDPWLSRSMRESFGLSPLERQIGLSAHDFCTALTAPKVYMTRSLKRDGTPTIPSRWWQRLSALLATDGQKLASAQPWATWSSQLDTPKESMTFAPPAPCPPIGVRPRRLSVTAVEKLMRDPYSIYAKTILKLEPLDPLDADLSLLEKGQAIHHILDAFVRSGVDPMAPEALTTLEEFGEKAFGKLWMDPRAKAFWWPRFQRLAQWFLTKVTPDQRIVTEVEGNIEIPTSVGPIILKGKADRIDILPSGQARIIDYKTGSVPLKRDVKDGYAPQLPLEAIILLKGGFTNVPSIPIEDLSYWKLTGGNPAGEIMTLENVEELILQADQGIRHLFEAFMAQETPFYACPDPAVPLTYNDYAHLERLKEWG